LRRGRADDGKAPYGTEGGERYGGSAGEQEIASGNGQINIPGLEGGYPFKCSI